MKALLHRSADRYYERLNQADKDRVDADDYWKPVIEPANPKEAAMIDKRVNEYERDPSSFVPRRKKNTIQ